MSSPFQQRARTSPGLFVLLAILALWLGWKMLVFAYSIFSGLALGLFTHLDASYGQLGGWPGYALLGLGLGAAAGAIAAQQRFRLGKRILAGAVAAVVVLLSGAFLVNANSHPTAVQDDSPVMDYNLPPLPHVERSQPEAAAEPAAAPVPDTTSQRAEGHMRVMAGSVPLLAHWTDSLAPTLAYLNEAETVRLLRVAHGWAQVMVDNPGELPGSTGWIRLTELGPLPATDLATLHAPAQVTTAPASDATNASSASAPESVAAAVWPTGHQQHTGQVGDQPATFSLNWQPNGELSGSYYYDQRPSTIYRLTGSGEPNGELHLLEFSRGRQSAQGTLRQEEGAYVGSIVNNDGVQLAMRFK